VKHSPTRVLGSISAPWRNRKDNKSEVLKQYRILTAPTVLFLDAKGKEIARYEGEDEKTVEEIRPQLKRMAVGELK
jgi:hypothetical protein